MDLVYLPTSVAVGTMCAWFLLLIMMCCFLVQSIWCKHASTNFSYYILY